jgi:hypothetical protein
MNERAALRTDRTSSTRTREGQVVPRLAVSPLEAAESLGVSKTYFDEHIAHELAWTRRGRRKFVSVRELERWLAATAERVLA